MKIGDKLDSVIDFSLAEIDAGVLTYKGSSEIGFSVKEAEVEYTVRWYCKEDDYVCLYKTLKSIFDVLVV